LVIQQDYLAYTFVTEGPWNIVHTALIWHWAIIICFHHGGHRL